MKFCVSFVFAITNKISVNRSAFQDKCIESLLEPETFTGPSNTNEGNESVLYSFCALVAALSGIKIKAIHSSEDALVQSTFARSRVEI